MAKPSLRSGAVVGAPSEWFHDAHMGRALGAEAPRCIREVGSSGEAQDSAAASSEGPPADAPPQGQRWPTAAKARAIVVEVAQRPPRPSSRAWLSSLVR